MSFYAIRENKILAKIPVFTVHESKAVDEEIGVLLNCYSMNYPWFYGQHDFLWPRGTV